MNNHFLSNTLARRCQAFLHWWVLGALADGPFDRGLSLALDRLLVTVENRLNKGMGGLIMKKLGQVLREDVKAELEEQLKKQQAQDMAEKLSLEATRICSLRPEFYESYDPGLGLSPEAFRIWSLLNLLFAANGEADLTVKLEQPDLAPFVDWFRRASEFEQADGLH